MEELLEPLSKQEALESIRKFKRDLGLNKKVDKKHIQDILKKSGSLSDEVNKMRHAVR
jgi:hypothetical protein